MRSVSALALFVFTVSSTAVAQPRSEQVDPSALAATAARLGRVIWSPVVTLDRIGVDPFVLRPPVAADCPDRTATSARQHITGSLALNIPYPRFWSSGDWHEHSAWFGAESDQVSEYSLASEQVHGPLLDKLGNLGLRDARGGLATLGHPAARQSRRIWAATHEPAVLEWCWSRIDEHTRPASR